jgi:hypothetical protein
MSDDDYGLGLKVHEDAYRELEEELVKAKSKLEEVGFRACCVLLERDEAREQRDRLAAIARELTAMIRVNVMWGRFAECTVEQIDEHLKPWNEKIAAVEGGQP